MNSSGHSREVTAYLSSSFSPQGFGFVVVYYIADIYGVEFNSCCIFLEWGVDLRSIWSLVL